MTTPLVVKHVISNAASNLRPNTGRYLLLHTAPTAAVPLIVEHVISGLEARAQQGGVARGLVVICGIGGTDVAKLMPSCTHSASLSYAAQELLLGHPTASTAVCPVVHGVGRVAELSRKRLPNIGRYLLLDTAATAASVGLVMQCVAEITGSPELLRSLIERAG